MLTDAVPSANGSLRSRTHMMFSHTTKGQLYNMALLSKFLSPGGQNVHNSNIHAPRLIDYELLIAEDGKRCVGFGWFAGGESVSGSRYLGTNSMCSVAGTLESLCAMAHAHLELGVASPFLVSFCLTCLSSNDVLCAISAVYTTSSYASLTGFNSRDFERSWRSHSIRWSTQKSWPDSARRNRVSIFVHPFQSLNLDMQFLRI